MKSIFVSLTLFSLALAWDHQRCLNFFNNPQQCINSDDARTSILRNHYFANANPVATYFTPLVFPFSTITTGTKFVARLFNFVTTYCNFMQHPDEPACVYVCPTPIGTRQDGFSPLKTIRIDIEVSAPNFRILTAHPIQQPQQITQDERKV